MTDIAKSLMPARTFLSDDFLQILYRLLAALLICFVLAVSTDSFLYLANILNVLRQASLLFFIASGLTLVVLTAGLDLSVGANVALSACVAGDRDRRDHRSAQWRNGHGLAYSLLHRDLWHALGAERFDLLVHGRRSHPWFLSRLSPDW
jgi:hypothetical protein